MNPHHGQGRATALSVANLTPAHPIGGVCTPTQMAPARVLRRAESG